MLRITCHPSVHASRFNMLPPERSRYTWYGVLKIKINDQNVKQFKRKMIHIIHELSTQIGKFIAVGTCSTCWGPDTLCLAVSGPWQETVWDILWSLSDCKKIRVLAMTLTKIPDYVCILYKWQRSVEAIVIHYNDVKWASWCIKYPAIPFGWFIHVNNKI